MGIVFTRCGIQNLANIIIVDLTHVDLVSKATLFLRNGYNDYNSSKGCVILQPTPKG
jgi:hypothetical protein